MSRPINIQDFVGKNDIRAWMHQPIQINGRLAATDGKSVFFTNEPSDLPDPETTAIEKIKQLLDMAADADFRPMPKLTFPEMPDCVRCGGSGKHSLKDCPECGGFGTAEAETDYNTYEVECRMCSGGGKIDSKKSGQDCESCAGQGKRWTENDRMKVEGLPCDMNPGLMSRIADVEGIQIATIDNGEIYGLAFKCVDGLGIIMGYAGAERGGGMNGIDARTILSLDERREKAEAGKREALLELAEMKHELQILRHMKREILVCLLDRRLPHYQRDGSSPSCHHTVSRIARIVRSAHAGN